MLTGAREMTYQRDHQFIRWRSICRTGFNTLIKSHAYSYLYLYTLYIANCMCEYVCRLFNDVVHIYTHP